MKELECPIPMILVPVDDTAESARAVEYAGCLAAPYGEAIQGITLIHVIGAGYFNSHAGYRDLRVLRVEESEAFRKLRELHYGRDIFPILERGAEILMGMGLQGSRIGRVVVHGKVWKELLAHAQAGAFSTLILARTFGEDDAEHDLGSAALTLLQRATGMDIYLVGTHVLEDKACPLPRILIPLDGSANAMKALDHAVCMARAVQGVSKITTLCVAGPEVKDAKAVLRGAQERLARWGIAREGVQLVERKGDPAKEIAAEAELGAYTTVVMGRRGQTGLKRLTLGGVALSVLHRTVSPTIALVSPAATVRGPRKTEISG
jgi:nucleotide-binding universal stress UspA family protein